MLEPCTDEDRGTGVVDLKTLSGGENVLLLSPHPGVETLVCGGFIAESCARGRPPFVLILTDGSGAPAAERTVQDRLAAESERAARAALASLGLPDGRLLFAGFHQGRAPRDGAAFRRAVEGLTMLSWRHDCNAICAPRPDPNESDAVAAHAMARATAEDQKLRLFCFEASRAPCASHRLDIAAHVPAKRRAVAMFGADAGIRAHERFCEIEDFRPPVVESGTPGDAVRQRTVS